MTKFALTDDMIDLRDVIERFEELETELQEAMDENEEGHNLETVDEYAEAARADCGPAHAHKLNEEAIEYLKLQEILKELCGGGGDEQWRGDWYPVTLINEDYFEKAMDELLEDIGSIPKDIPSYLTITVDYEALKSDYTQIEIDDQTYWYR